MLYWLCYDPSVQGAMLLSLYVLYSAHMLLLPVTRSVLNVMIMHPWLSVYRQLCSIMHYS